VVVFRAGIVEELFYRGYTMERLQSMGLSRGAAAIIPLAIFSVGHWTGGVANILIAAVLGGVLTAFCLWRRDRVANIFAHTLGRFCGQRRAQTFCLAFRYWFSTSAPAAPCRRR